MYIKFERSDDDYYGIQEYVMPVVRYAIKSPLFLDALCMVLNTYDTYTEHIVNDVDKMLKCYGNLHKDDMTEVEGKEYGEFHKHLYEFYWTIIDDDFGKKVREKNQDLYYKKKLRYVTQRLGRYRGILLEKTIAAMVEGRFNQDLFEQGCRIKIDNSWIRIGYNYGNTNHKETFDIAGWKSTAKYGEFYECKVNPKRFENPNYKLFAALKKALDQCDNVNYILALVSSDAREKLIAQKKFLDSENEGTTDKIEFQTLGREDLYDILTYQVPEIA